MSYIDDSTANETTPVVKTVDCGNCISQRLSDTGMILSKPLFTFLLTTTVIAFAGSILLICFATYYIYGTVFKKRISFGWCFKKEDSRKVSTTTKSDKCTKALGYCEHCKGACCQIQKSRQNTLLRQTSTLRSVGRPTIIKNQHSSTLSRIGSWGNSIYTSNKNENYNLSNQFTYES